MFDTRKYSDKKNKCSDKKRCEPREREGQVKKTALKKLSTNPK